MASLKGSLSLHNVTCLRAEETAALSNIISARSLKKSSNGKNVSVLT